ncbi:MAG TPA: hypothetical protein VKQ71_10845 [Acidimicrobiales bacterium]|nr:hypothetical protein [Acidimicrobiales bacterium]
MSVISALARRRPHLLAATAGLLGVVGLAAGPISSAGASGGTSFPLFANPSVVGCLGVEGRPAPTATVTVNPGELNDTMTVRLNHFKPGLAFDLFTVQRSNQQADGSANPTPGFGLAWYQSDIQVGNSGTATAHIRTILLNQIFGFDPDVKLAPTNTFHVGFWFNNPNDAASCGFTGFTPFNGEHHAGPLAMISRPDAATNLGPLCTKPDTSAIPATCNP